MNRPHRRKTQTVALYLALLFVVIIFMFLLRQCSSARQSVETEYESAGGDTLDIAIEYAPMSMYTYNDTLGGFNYDLLRLIERKYSLPMKFHPIVSRQEGLAGIADSTFDILVADIPATLGNEDKYIFTEPVYLDRQVLVQRRDSLGKVAVSSVLELGGHTVWVVKDSPMAVRLHNLSEEIGDTIYVKEYTGTSSEQLVILTSIGEIEMCVVNEQTAKRLVNTCEGLDISTKVSFTQFQSWLTRHNHTLADSINRILIDIKSSPDYANLRRRYLNQ